MIKKYQPRQGDIIWIDMTPQAGHEIAKRRPALVIWGNDAHTLIGGGQSMVCPITSKDKRSPVHIPLDEETTAIHGFVICDQAKTLDLWARNAEYVDRASDAVVDEVRDTVKSLLD